MAASFVALQKTTINNLSPYITNVFIVGVIIAKQKPRKFEDLKSNIEGLFRGVWNFTLRDSPKDYINVTYWDTYEAVFQLNDKFHTGDVIEVLNPIVKVRNLDDRAELFQPMVTSPYSLILSKESNVVLHGDQRSAFLNLLKLPTKPLAGFVPLRDIHNSGASIQDYVNILVIVKGLGQIRTVTSRINNETLITRSVKVFDHTSPCLILDVWENDIIKRSENWKPKCTALFITDLKIQWSNFHKQFTAKCTSRSVITENPNGKEVEMLLDYAKNAPIETFDIVDHIITTLPDANTIQDIMNVKQVHDRIKSCTGEAHNFTALLYSFVSKLDLDGMSKTLSIKCGKCKLEIKGTKCENIECPTVFENEQVESEISFDIRITLADHTGSLKNCMITNSAVEQALGCTAREFFNMSDDEKRILKWKYLLERCAVSVAIIFVGRQIPVISILKIDLADSTEVSQRLAVL